METDTGIIKVIFKLEGREKYLLGFLPDFAANVGNIQCVEYCGASGEASLEYFRKLKTVTKTMLAKNKRVRKDVRSWISANVRDDQRAQTCFRDSAKMRAQRYEWGC